MLSIFNIHEGAIYTTLETKVEGSPLASSLKTHGCSQKRF